MPNNYDASDTLINVVSLRDASVHIHYIHWLGHYECLLYGNRQFVGVWHTDTLHAADKIAIRELNLYINSV